MLSDPEKILIDSRFLETMIIECNMLWLYGTYMVEKKSCSFEFYIAILYVKFGQFIQILNLDKYFFL
jgi:hypothetical protein